MPAKSFDGLIIGTGQAVIGGSYVGLEFAQVFRRTCSFRPRRPSYQLVRQKSLVQDRLVEIEFLDPGAEVFAFTFG